MASDIVADVAFSVPFVCSGNICRSPIAERLFLARMDPDGPATASSAGTAGVTGAPMDARAARVLRDLGGDGEGHVARRLEPAMIAESDLILTGLLGSIGKVRPPRQLHGSQALLTTRKSRYGRRSRGRSRATATHC